MRERSPVRMGGLAGLALAVLVAASLALHLAALWQMGDALEPDEAVVALMGKHILEGRSRPVFYYGQPYLGSLQAWLVAGVYALTAVAAAPARLVSLAASLALVIVVFLLGRRWGGWVGLAAALGVALPPPDVLAWHLKLRGGFMLSALLLALVLQQTCRVAEGHTRPARLLGLGLVAGLAVWTNQLALPFVLVALAVAWREARTRAGATAMLGAGTIAGALPLLVYNLAHPARTFLHLGAHYLNVDVGGDGLGAGLLEGLRVTLLVELPANLGRLLLDTGPRLVGGASLPLPWRLLPALGLVLLVVTGSIARYRSRGPWPARVCLPLAAVGLALVFRRNAELNQLLHVSALLPLAALSVATARRRVAWAVALLALPGLGESGLASARGRLPLPPRAPHALVAHLEEHGLRRVYTEHRPAYLLAFYSEERIAASPLADFDWPRDRWPPYTAQVEGATRPAFVFEAGSPNAVLFEERCLGAGGGFRREQVGEHLVYDRLTCSRADVFRSATPPSD